MYTFALTQTGQFHKTKRNLIIGLAPFLDRTGWNVYPFLATIMIAGNFGYPNIVYLKPTDEFPLLKYVVMSV
jgi:hypothetical protein